MTDPHKEIPPLKRAALQVVAGGSAGFVEVCIMQPLDVVKTRMQLQNTKTLSEANEMLLRKLRGSCTSANKYFKNSSDNITVKRTIYHGTYHVPMVKRCTNLKRDGHVAALKAKQNQYKGVFDCFGKMYKNEGLLSFWKGILPPVLAETPKRAIKFVCFEQCKPLFLFGSPTPTPLTFSLAGLTAGLIEAIAVNPFEVVKVAQQADHSRMKEAPGTWAVTKDIIKRDGFGFRGLNKGVTATMGRNGTFNMIYFGFYHSVRNYVPAYEDQTKEFLRKVAIGFTSGTIACFVNIPFDVAKSRIQGPQPQAGVIKYKSTFGSILTVYREEGFRALYKGIVPKIMRLGPGGAIMLLVFEYAYEFLQDKYA